MKIWAPEMKNERCSEVIMAAFRQYSQLPNMDGSIMVDNIKFDLKERSITVEFDSMKVALKNLEHIVAGAGFAANDIPADTNAVAKLPPECRL